jgi:pimeloyl-ACP methyl ester carboxylesterase
MPQATAQSGFDEVILHTAAGTKARARCLTLAGWTGGVGLHGSATKVHARWYTYPGSRGAVLYCHGNAGDLTVRAQAVQHLSEALQQSVLIFDYPGYGYSEGEPSEEACYAAASAAYDWLTRVQQLSPEDILIYGESLGGGVAIDLAARLPHRALILVKTFTSIPDLAQEHLPLLPVRWLITNRFDNLAKIGNCKKPILIAHGDADQLIPFAHGQRLAASNPSTEFFRLQGADHNDPLGTDFYTALQRFLDKTP